MNSSLKFSEAADSIQQDFKEIYALMDMLEKQPNFQKISNALRDSLSTYQENYKNCYTYLTKQLNTRATQNFKLQHSINKLNQQIDRQHEFNTNKQNQMQEQMTNLSEQYNSSTKRLYSTYKRQITFLQSTFNTRDTLKQEVQQKQQIQLKQLDFEFQQLIQTDGQLESIEECKSTQDTYRELQHNTPSCKQDFIKERANYEPANSLLNTSDTEIKPIEIKKALNVLIQAGILDTHNSSLHEFINLSQQGKDEDLELLIQLRLLKQKLNDDKETPDKLPQNNKASLSKAIHSNHASLSSQQSFSTTTISRFLKTRSKKSTLDQELEELLNASSNGFSLLDASSIEDIPEITLRSPTGQISSSLGKTISPKVYHLIKQNQKIKMSFKSLAHISKRFIKTPFEFQDLLNLTESNSDNIRYNFHLYSQPLDTQSYIDEIIESPFYHPPRLQHNLNKIIRTEGIYPVDQFIKLNNSRFLKKIIHPSPDIFERFPPYTPPSKDKTLAEYGRLNKINYVTGSSSITEALQHVFYLMTNFRSPNVSGLGKFYDNRNMNYMSAYRKPTTIMLRKRGDIYSIDGDSGFFPKQNQLLTDLGIYLETMLTTDEKTFLEIIDTSKPLSDELKGQVLASNRSYRFRRFGNLLVRSQIDCEGMDADGDLFVFEIKTRATAPQRYDVSHLKDYIDYRIEKREGLHSSYEREYFDMVRSLMLKYYFQTKLGRMDGTFITYHNTEEIFGFEYIRIQELEKRIFGCSNFGTFVLKSSVQILELVLDHIVKQFPNDEMLRIGFLARYKFKDMLITVERFKSQTDWSDGNAANENVLDEYDYYELNDPDKTAYCLCLRLFPYLNGILQNEPVFIDPGDKLDLRYSIHYHGVLSFDEYMLFLHNAFKHDSTPYFNEFQGAWKKFNDFHVYRKPIYKA